MDGEEERMVQLAQCHNTAGGGVLESTAQNKLNSQTCRNPSPTSMASFRLRQLASGATEHM